MQPNTKTKALDIFFYVGIGIALIASITNILTILFEAINRKFPDVLTATYYVDPSYSNVRLAIATLVIMFPVYLLLSWLVEKDITKFLYKQDIFIRKVLIYGAIFISVLTLIGALVSVIYTFLGGELSIRFFLKASSLVLITVWVLGYYIYLLKRNYANKSYTPFTMGLLSSVGVVLAIVWSISVVGTPAQMRAKKIDNTRLSDISRIQQELFNRVQSTDKLPLELSELENVFQGYVVPSDPVTQEAYKYNVVKQATFKMNYVTNKKELVTPAVFEICATFETVREHNERGVSMPSKGGIGFSEESMFSAGNYYYDGDMSPFWNHGIGETCFKRVISSEMYYGR